MRRFLQHMPRARGHSMSTWLLLGAFLSPCIGMAQLTASGTETKVNDTTRSTQQHPQIAVNSNGDYAAVWSTNLIDGDGFGIAIKGVSGDGSTWLSERILNGSVDGNQSHPDVAINSTGDYVVAWMSNSPSDDSDGFGIRHQRAKTNGNVIVQNLKTNSTDAGQQRFPKVALAANGVYAIVWESAGDIKWRRYNNTGTATGPEVTVNTTQDSIQGYPDIAMDNAGNVVIVWQSLGQDSDGYGIYAQRYGTDTSKVGTEFKVHTDSIGHQIEPKVSMSTSGDFVVTWSSFGTDGDGYGVYAQQFLSDGTPSGSQFRVNETTSNFQMHPDVDHSPGGTFVITYASWGHDADQAAVLARLYRIDGTSAGSTVQVNTNEQDFQTLPGVSFGQDENDLLFIWQDGENGSSTTQEGDEFGIYLQEYSVADIIAPVAVAQDISVYLDGSGNATIAAIDLDSGSTDSNGIESYTASKTSFGCADLGSNLVTLTVFDPSGNSDEASATVTVVDSTAPVMVAQSLSVYLDAMGNALISSVDLDAGTSDNCGFNLSLNDSIFDCGDVGSLNVTLTAIDPSGNSSSIPVAITVTDSVSPVIASFTNPTAYLDAGGNASLTHADFAIVANDACGAVSLDLSDSTFTCDQVGVQVVTITVIDGSGNSTVAYATVSVLDTLSPTAAAQDLTAYLDAAGSVTLAALDLNAGSSDNCNYRDSISQATFTCDNLGANAVTYFAVDNSGNTSSAGATVTVLDTLKPTLSLMASATLNLDASGNATLTFKDLDNGSFDNCSFTPVLSRTNFSCSDLSTHTITVTITDPASNSAQGTIDVTVMDVTAPIVLTQNITVVLDGSGTATIAADQINEGSFDACGIKTLSLDKTTFTCSDIGMITVTLTAIDSSGNSGSSTAMVTVDGGSGFSGPEDCDESALILDLALDNCAITSVFNSVDDSNVGTVNGGSYTSGYVNQGLYFDGVDDYINLGTNSALAFDSAFSVAMWVKTNSGATQWLIGRNLANNNYSWSVRLSGGLVQASLGGLSLPGPYTGSSWIADDNWHHVAVSFGNQTLAIYVDGVLDVSYSVPNETVNLNPTAEVWAGMRSDMLNDRQFTGYMDDIQIYGGTLAANQASALASAGSNPVACAANESSLQAYFLLDDCNTTVLDNAADLATDGTLVNDAEILAGFNNQAAWFDGVNDYAQLGDTGWDLGANDAFTYSFWVYPERTTGTREALITRNEGSLSSLIALSSLDVEVYLGGLSNGGWYRFDSALAHNAWNHVGVTYENGTLRGFVNGQLSNEWTGLSGSINFSSTGQHYIGARTDGSKAFMGGIDEVRFFNEALSPETIGTEFTRISSSPVNCSDVLIGAWLFNDCNSTTAFDSLGIHDGTIMGATRGTGYSSYGMSFDGVNDYVNLGNASTFELTDEFTLAMWVNTTQQDNYAVLMTKNKLGSSFSYQVMLHNGQPTISLGGLSSAGPFSAATNVATGTWTHLAWRLEDGTLTTFVNGNPVATHSGLTGTLNTNAGSNLWLGWRNDKSTRQYQGDMDEVKIFSNALTSTNIAALANQAQNSQACVVSREGLSSTSLLQGAKVFVYPNPNQGTFRVAWPKNPTADLQISVTNALGQSVYDYQGNVRGREHEIRMAENTPGIYFLSITEGNRHIIQRIVVE